MRVIYILPLILLAACAKPQEAKTKYVMAGEAYSQCLLKNPNKPAQCEGLRVWYEVEKSTREPVREAAPVAAPVFQQEQPRIWMMNQGSKTYSCNNFGGMVNCN